jgi:beta-galactosidase
MASSIRTKIHAADIIHTEGARVLATYGDDFYAGTPVVTENNFGQGHAYYIASDAEDQFLDHFYGHLLEAHGIAPLLDTPVGVEVTLRETEQRRLLFVLNHNAESARVALPAGGRFWDHLREQVMTDTLELPGYGVSILEAQP